MKQAILDKNGVLVSLVESDLLQFGGVEITQVDYDNLTDMTGRKKQVNGVWVDYTPPALPIEILRGQAKEAVVAFASQIGAQLTAGYPLVEREAWITKLTEAKAIVAGETDPLKYPVISAEIGVTGQTAAMVAPVILAKAVLFQKASGLISGMRQQTFAAIDASQSQAEIDAVIAAAKSSAEAAMAALLAGN